MPIKPSDITLSIFFPAYYDEKNIGKVTELAVEVCEALELKDYEITIIEDGSPDKTGEVADALAERFEHVKVIHHAQNMGYGATLAEGFNSAKMQYVFYTDGDNQFDMRELAKFIKLVPYTDIVSGFRISKQYSAYRRVTSSVYNYILRRLFDLTDRDVDCAFKLFPRELFDRITIESNDAFIDAEIAIKARLLNYRTTEVGVTHYPRVDGISTAARPSRILTTIAEMKRYYLKYRRDIRASRKESKRALTDRSNML